MSKFSVCEFCLIVEFHFANRQIALKTVVMGVNYEIAEAAVAVGIIVVFVEIVDVEP